MRKLCMLMLLSMLLSGCGQKSYETRTAPCGAQESPSPGVISICATDEMLAPVMSTQAGDKLYIADDYEVTLQTMDGGDLDTTLKSCTGFDRERLTVLETQKDGFKRYDCAWTALGEGAESVGRVTILDDGYYHYVLTVTGADGEKLSAVWQQLSDSFRVSIGQ